MPEIIESSAADPVIYESLYIQEIYFEYALAETFKEANKILSKTYASNKELIRSSLKSRISKASKMDWNTVATQDSFGISRNRRISKSMSTAYKQTQADIKKLRDEIRRIDKNIAKGNFGRLKKYGDLSKKTANQARSIAINKAVTTQQNNTKKYLGYHENRLSRTEAKSIWHGNYIKKHGDESAKWICGPAPCPLCSPYCEIVFKKAIDAPMIPIHGNCQCGLEPTGK